KKASSETWRSLPANFKQPHPGHGPVPADGRLADPEQIGDLLILKPNEVPHLHHLRLRGILLCERVKRFVYQQQALIGHRCCDLSLDIFNPLLVAASFELTVPASTFHENPAHGLSGGGKEHCPIF